MNKCKRCNVWVADDTMVCPLCHTILTENKSMEQSLDHNANKMQGVQRPGYPDVKKNTRRFRKAGRILLFISLAVEMLLAFINYLTFDAAPKYWSVVTGGNHCVSDSDPLGYFQQKTGAYPKDLYTDFCYTGIIGAD